MRLIKPQKKFIAYVSGVVLLVSVALAIFSIGDAGTLTCLATIGACPGAGVAVFKMQDSSNAHAELPTGSSYGTSICCENVDGLTNSCSGTYAVVLRLSGATNAHVEYGTSTTPGYDGNDVCLSAQNITVGYQASNCNGYDTTIASMSSTTVGTNAHVGDSAAYSTKICGTASAASVVSISVTDGGIDYGIVPTSASSTTVGGSETQNLVNNGDGAETFSIKGQDTACPWILADAIGPNNYKLEHSTTTGSTWATVTSGGYTPMITNVAKDSVTLADFRITMPSSTACTTTQNADVVIQATSYP